MTPDEEAETKRRQKSRNLVVGGTLIFFAVLFYAITLVRLGD
ncbi:hypothetical protein [uncultured Erythrobacter sp.]|nr:hypothetical protein [uncultured Erythrobacter sp.]